VAIVGQIETYHHPVKRTPPRCANSRGQTSSKT
jgi:hypothetical protein